jgi:hypothetical protein
MVDKLFRVAVLALTVVALLIGVQTILNNAQARACQSSAH